MKRLRPRGAEGFTLLEMLVALTLLGLISVVAFDGLRFGTRAWEAGARRADDISEIEAVQNFLRRQMSRMLLPEDAVDERSEAALRGEEAAFQFLTVIPPELGVGGIALFRLYTEYSQGTGSQGTGSQAIGQLVMDWAIYRPDGLVPPPGTTERRRSLLQGIKALRFRYFGSLREGDEPAWRDAWFGSERLPHLISLDVDFADGDPRRWPELSVAPRRAIMSIRP
jgi:general secretion pathway protein J